jgi:hypothetical protein
MSWGKAELSFLSCKSEQISTVIAIFTGMIGVFDSGFGAYGSSRLAKAAPNTIFSIWEIMRARPMEPELLKPYTVIR